MSELIGPWSHLLATLCYGLLAIWQLRRWPQGIEQRMFAAGFAVTAIWAFAVTVTLEPVSPVAGVAESLRNLAWLGFLLTMLSRSDGARRTMVFALAGTLTALVAALSVIDLLPYMWSGGALLVEALFFIGVGLRLMVVIGGLLIVHHLYSAAEPEARWGIRLPMVALAALWIYDLNLYTVAYLSGGWPGELFALRGACMLLLVPLFLLATRRNRRWTLKLSRAATFQSLSLLAVGVYLIVMVVATRLVELVGGRDLRMMQVGLIFAMALAALVLLPSRRVRAWLKVMVSKHFFQHRYDYREEWLRFTGTLGLPGADAAPLDCRVVKAIADITKSPGGLLLLPDGRAGGLVSGARWNWQELDAPLEAGSPAFMRYLESTGRILEFDPLREGEGEEAETAVTPEWMLAETAAWAAVPLIHIDQLAGVVLLARPRLDRQLDWEDFDLLRVVGRQVATYLAEQGGQEALSEARRFDEFNRRFAFIMHDIKNLVSQLSLLSRNAERHADNPEFRRDMIATLQASVGKMNDMLARLSQHNRAAPAEPRPLPVRPFLGRIAGEAGRAHPVELMDGAALVVRADPARLEQALRHLVQNAIDATRGRTPVQLAAAERDGSGAIMVIDRGSGMSAEFIRNGLFRAFNSTKSGGFGVGAFEARMLVEAMGGRIEVESREGEGSKFTVVLPLAQAGDAAETPMLQRRRA